MLFFFKFPVSVCALLHANYQITQLLWQHITGRLSQHHPTLCDSQLWATLPTLLTQLHLHLQLRMRWHQALHPYVSTPVRSPAPWETAQCKSTHSILQHLHVHVTCLKQTRCCVTWDKAIRTSLHVFRCVDMNFCPAFAPKFVAAPYRCTWFAPPFGLAVKWTGHTSCLGSGTVWQGGCAGPDCKASCTAQKWPLGWWFQCSLHH